MTTLDVTVRIGGVFATDREAVLRTVLGSCISTCLFDPVSRVGGMNHFMLPSPDDASEHWEPTRFGVNAMEVLIGALQRLGARRDRLQAKVFGGGHLLNTLQSHKSVPARNIAFVEQFMREEQLEIVSQDLGGYLARRVHFYPRTGKVLVKRLGEHAIRELALEETQVERAPTEPLPSSIELFD